MSEKRINNSDLHQENIDTKDDSVLNKVSEEISDLPGGDGNSTVSGKQAKKKRGSRGKGRRKKNKKSMGKKPWIIAGSIVGGLLVIYLGVAAFFMSHFLINTTVNGKDFSGKTVDDVEEYLKQTDPEDLPVVPMKYQLSQICIYPDREAADMAVKERLLAIRERIINGEKFSTLARIYSQDPGSAMKGGELGMASKSIFWPAFSDAAMSLKPGVVSQIVETPDGFHIIEVLEKKGDMFNARHILLKPEYTVEDKEKAFHVLDSLKTEMANGAVTFEMAARFYSEDPATRTNGGQMADPNSGSSYFEIDQLKPQDYAAIKDLKEGEISEPVESLDNEGRDGNTVYKIIKVDKILPSHTASFNDDYSLLSEQVKQKASMKAVDDFIDAKLKTTYIVIDPLFKYCEFDNEGWADKFREN